MGIFDRLFGLRDKKDNLSHLNEDLRSEILFFRKLEDLSSLKLKMFNNFLSKWDVNHLEQLRLSLLEEQKCIQDGKFLIDSFKQIMKGGGK